MNSGTGQPLALDLLVKAYFVGYLLVFGCLGLGYANIIIKGIAHNLRRCKDVWNGLGPGTPYPEVGPPPDLQIILWPLFLWRPWGVERF